MVDQNEFLSKISNSNQLTTDLSKDLLNISESFAKVLQEKDDIIEQLLNKLNKSEAELHAKDTRIENYIHKLTKRIIKLEISQPKEQDEALVLEKLRNENVKLFLKIGDLKKRINELESIPSGSVNVVGEERLKSLVKTVGIAVPESTEQLAEIAELESSISASTTIPPEPVDLDKPIIQTATPISLSKHPINQNNIPKPNLQTPTIHSIHLKPNTVPKPNPSFKFQEVVRSKQTRTQMHGVSCECCSDFYKATNTLKRPKKLGEAERERVDVNSRHRVWSKRPSTPPGYWQVDFPTSQELKEYQK